MFKLKLIVSLITVLASLSGAYAVGPDEFEYTQGWTGSINIRPSQDTNLTQSSLQFKIDKGTVGAVWGLAGAPLTFSQAGSVVKLSVGQRWDGKGDFILDADKEIMLQFSPSVDQFTLSDFFMGNKKYLLKGSNSLPVVVQSKESKQEEVNLNSSPVDFDFTPPQKIGKTRSGAYIDFGLDDVTGWSQKENSMQPIHLPHLLTKSGFSEFRMAFVTSESNQCEPTIAGYSPVKGFCVEIFKALKDKGIKITQSFGGASGTYLEQTAKSPEELFGAYRKVITTYDPYGLDFDIENRFESHHPEKLDQMMQAIQGIQKEYPKLELSFTLPVMPEGLVPGNGLGVLEKAMAYKINCSFNIMAMDYGLTSSSNPKVKSMGAYAIDAVKSLFSQLKIYSEKYGFKLPEKELKQKIQVTTMIGMNDTAPENFDLKDANDLRKFADEYGLGMLLFWSLNRDHKGEGNFTNIKHSSTNPMNNKPNQENDWEYAKAFLGKE